MELWIWPLSCSIFLSLSIFFYLLKYPINFQTEKAPAFTLQPKHPFPEKENFVTYDLLFSSGKKWNVVKAYWSTLLHFCFMIGYRFSLCVKLRCKAKSFPLIQSWFKLNTAHIVFLKSFNKLYIFIKKTGPCIFSLLILNLVNHLSAAITRYSYLYLIELSLAIP